MARHEHVAGLHAARWLLQRAAERVLVLVVDDRRRDARLDEIRGLARRYGVAVESAGAMRLDRLAEGARHQGVVAVVRPRRPLDDGDLDALLDPLDAPLLVALDGVQDPRNLGAVLRTADAAGVDAVVVPRKRAAGLTPAARKVACGAAETVPLAVVTNLARTLGRLGDAGMHRIGLAGEAQTRLFATTLTGPVCLVMGGEAGGLRRLTRERCDELVRLPMLGAVESLNVSAAAAVALYEAVRQRGAAGSDRVGCVAEDR